VLARHRRMGTDAVTNCDRIPTETQLPDKALLQSKLLEFYLQNLEDEGDPA
jgi:hypothetical protein